jgi:voltage-gated potassium channel
MADAPEPRGAGERLIVRRIERHGLHPRVAAAIIASVWIVAIIIFGIIERLVDPGSFDTVWLGMWWATETVTTVGYGDVVPNSTAGMLIGVVLMVGGLSLFAVITGVITSVFVAHAQAERQESDDDPVTGRLDRIASELGALRAEVDRLSGGHAEPS